MCIRDSITSMRKCESTKDIHMWTAGIQGNVQVWIEKGTHEFAKRKLERLTRGLEGWSSEQSAGDPRYRCELWSTIGRIHPLLAPWPGHENPGESVKLPRRVVIWCQVASQDEHRCQVQKTGGLEHNEVYMNGYDIIIIKQENQVKLI